MDTKILKYMLIFCIAILLATSMFFEKFRTTKKIVLFQMVINIIILVITLVYFIISFSNTKIFNTYIYGISLTVGILLFVSIPFLFKREFFELYVMRLFMAFLRSVIVTFVLYITVCIFLYSIDQIVGIDVKKGLYDHILYMLLDTVALWIFMGYIPRGKIILEKEPYSLVVEISILRIIRPVIYYSLAIIYLYFALNIVYKHSFNTTEIFYMEMYILALIIMQILVTPLVDKDEWSRTFNF